ncbi:MAG: hypothetical protein ACRD8Z_08435 [Nitrososphaeraceae archaeon]
MNISVIVLALILFALPPTIGAFASVSQELSDEEKESKSFDKVYVIDTQDRPATNLDVDPDQDCNIAYELKCVPGFEQGCPEGFHNGEDNVCSPIKCPEGYHVVDDDETGLCYPNSEADCDSNYVITYEGVRYDYVFVEGEDGKNDRCANPGYLCDDESSHEIFKEFLNNN